jgi:hypothetical protein
LEKMICAILTAVTLGIRTAASWKARIRAVPWSSRGILVVAGLLFLLVALVAPVVPVKAYYRLPSDGGVFEPPVDLDWVGRHECIVHVVNQTIRGDYYLECPYTNHRLLFWSPVIALSGVLFVSVGIRTTRGKPLLPMPNFAAAVEVLTGAEAMIAAFFSLFMRPEFETYVGLLGYPIGFLLVLDGLRRRKASHGEIVSAAVIILLISGVFFFALIGAMAMSEY